MARFSHGVRFGVLLMAPFLTAGLASAFDAAPRAAIQGESVYVLAKSGKSAAQRTCEAKCKKDYRRCYSEGNRPGTPEVQGGESCTEQKTTCMRACQDNN